MLDTTAQRPHAHHTIQPPPSGLSRWAQQAYRLPFAAPIPHLLEQEFHALPPKTRRQLGWKVLKRKAWLRLSGHGLHARAAIPAGARRVLWLYTWTTVGDAVMDLSARHLFPDTLAVDLHIAPQLAGLFEHDPRFGRVHTGSEPVGDYDFVLLQDLHAASLRLKRRLAPRVPFASMLDCLHGEMFHRVAFAHQRLAQLLGQAEPALRQPWLGGMDGTPTVPGLAARHIALALGARDARRRYGQWPAVMRQLLDAWPAHLPAPRFVLLGNGNAHEDFVAIAQAGLLAHCDMQLDSPSLPALARAIASCDGFLGADGGPMHLALALARPGVALFGPVPAPLRLSGNASLAPLAGAGDINRIAPSEVARLALQQLAG